MAEEVGRGPDCIRRSQDQICILKIPFSWQCFHLHKTPWLKKYARNVELVKTELYVNNECSYAKAFNLVGSGNAHRDPGLLQVCAFSPGVTVIGSKRQGTHGHQRKAQAQRRNKQDQH